MTMSIPTLVTFIIYLVGMLGIGLVAYKMTNNLSDYILGGRKLGSAVTALSAGASDMSAWLLLGLPGAIYVGGLSESWIALGLVIGAYLNWKLSAPRLRVYTEVAGDAITLPDYLQNRFNDKSQLLRVISAFIILIFFTFYTSSGMVAGATLFESSFGIAYSDALLIGALVIVSYTFIGGFLAVCWTDFFQAILMMFALVVAPIVVIYELNGLSNTLNIIESVDPVLSDWTKGLTLIGFLSLQAWGLGYFGQPHILVRFMAIDNVKSVKAARRIGMTWMIISLFGALVTGFAGIAYFHDKPDEIAKLVTNSEAIFILITQVAFNPWIAGFLLAAILAAIMSTIDSQLLICSGTITEDFYKKFFRRQASEKELILTGRISVLAIAILAVWIGQDPDSKVLSLVSYAWAGFGAGFGPVVLFSLLYRKMTRNGALAGMLVGAITVVVWKQQTGGLFDLYELLPGFVFASLAIIIVSKVGKEPEQSILDTFDEVKQIVHIQS